MRGRRRAVSESATASYDETVANYRQAALTAFQEVEDNLATLRVLEEQSKAQRVAVEAAQQSLRPFALNRYKGGLVTYLEVITAQSIALQNRVDGSGYSAPAHGCQRTPDQSAGRRLGRFQAAYVSNCALPIQLGRKIFGHQVCVIGPDFL